MRFCFQFYTLSNFPVSELMGMILTKQLGATSSNQQRIQQLGKKYTTFFICI